MKLNNIASLEEYAAKIAAFDAIVKEDRKIIVFAKSLISLQDFFEKLDQILPTSLKNGKSWIDKPYMQRGTITGSIIRGYVMYGDNNSGTMKRGISADTVITLNTKDYTENDWIIIKPICEGDQFRENPTKTYVFK